MDKPWRGVYGILLTTYVDRDEVDTQDLAAEADFVASTAQGIVWPVMASEFYIMADEEKVPGYAAVVAGNRHRVPFVAGVTSLTTRGAAKLAEAAAKAGAEAVIAMAPYMKKASSDELVKHFQAIAGAGLPVFIQNAAWLAGAGNLGVAELRMLAEKIPQVQYLKEETPPMLQNVSKVLREMPGLYKGVFAGGGARWLMDELNRGAAGNMPACEWADVFGHAFDLWEKGEKAEARRIHAAALAGYNVELAYSAAGNREVLKRRGVIRSTNSRYSAKGGGLEPEAIAEIEATIEFLSPYFRWPDHKLHP